MTRFGKLSPTTIDCSKCRGRGFIEHDGGLVTQCRHCAGRGYLRARRLEASSAPRRGADDQPTLPRVKDTTP